MCTEGGCYFFRAIILVRVLYFLLLSMAATTLLYYYLHFPIVAKFDNAVMVSHDSNLTEVLRFNSLIENQKLYNVRTTYGVSVAKFVS